MNFSILKNVSYSLTTASSLNNYEQEIFSFSDYYPGGSLMPGRYSGGNDYRYKHQGQESDPEIYGEGNSYVYKYHMSDPRLIRMWSVDPLAHDYPWNSPYAFSENRLIDAVELEGLEKRIIHKTDLGNGETVITVVKTKTGESFNLKDEDGNFVVGDQNSTLVIQRQRNKDGKIVVVGQHERPEDAGLSEAEKEVEKDAESRNTDLQNHTVEGIGGKIFTSDANTKTKQTDRPNDKLKPGNLQGATKNFKNKDLDTGGKYGCTTCTKTGTLDELKSDGAGVHEPIPIKK